MKAAKARDVWVKVLKRAPGQLALKSLATTNVRGLGQLHIRFESNFSAICGENGAGKTTLLRTLFTALQPRPEETCKFPLKPQKIGDPFLAVVSLEISGALAGPNGPRMVNEPAEVATILAPDGDGPTAEYVDAALTSQRIKYVIQNDNEFSSAFEGCPEIEDTAEVLSIRKEITGRGYDKFLTFEIEDYSLEPVFPYFKACSGGIEYGSEDMGLGELCVNYLIWALSRLRTNSILLLEEPESHLPPRAQEALMNYVALTAWNKNLTVVVSTHSQHTLKQVPRAHITLLARQGAQLLCSPSPAQSILFESLRIGGVKPAVLVAEDHSAAIFLRTLIAQLDEQLLEIADIGWTNGYTGIDAVFSSLPKEFQKVGFVGVYDGDQRNQIRPVFDWPHFFLPGEGDPLNYLVQLVKARPLEFSDMFGIDSQPVKIALAVLGQTDDKDYFLQLSKAVGEVASVSTLYKMATRLWIGIAANKKLGNEFVSSLRKAILHN